MPGCSIDVIIFESPLINKIMKKSYHSQKVVNIKILITGQVKATNKQSGGNQNKAVTSVSSKTGSDKKSPCSSPKPAVPESENEDGKSDLKVLYNTLHVSKWVYFKNNYFIS